MTYTFAELEVSRATYDEIAAKLKAAGYESAFVWARGQGSGTPTIDMQGIGLVRAEALPRTPSYLEKLASLPPKLRREFIEGSWDHHAAESGVPQA